jgi:hypothetical protein
VRSSRGINCRCVQCVKCVQMIKLGRVEIPYIYTINQAGPSVSRAIISDTGICQEVVFHLAVSTLRLSILDEVIYVEGRIRILP